MYKVMLVEDDEAILKELTILLENQSYEVVCWDLKSNIVNVIKEKEPQIILLDINLPHTDGFTLCSQIRKVFTLPIIFVTSRNSDMDELCSMTMGGDDYITKPYNASILLARLSALLKRTYEQKDALLVHKGVALDIALSRILYEDKTVELTKNEVRILYYLFLHKGEIVSRDQLIDYLWDNKLFIDDNALSVNVTRIRSKLKEIGALDYIVTRHRQGYVI